MSRLHLFRGQSFEILELQSCHQLGAIHYHSGAKDVLDVGTASVHALRSKSEGIMSCEMMESSTICFVRNASIAIMTWPQVQSGSLCVQRLDKLPGNTPR
jgi:hypothetical protein